MSQIVINEVYPNPDGGDEWVEFFYPFSSDQTQATIDLTGWTLWDQLSSSSRIYQFDQQSISPGEYLIVPINNKLNNAGDGVILKDQDQQIIDQMNYQNSQPGLSFARLPNGSGDFLINLASPAEYNTDIISHSPTPSPTAILSPTAAIPTQSSSPSPTASTIPTLSPTSDSTALSAIKLSEIMACPSIGNEWIEFYNSDSKSINLNDLQIWDEKNLIYSFQDELISAQSYLVIEIYSKLNNSGDSIVLKSINNDTIDQFSYSNCHKDHSFIFHQGEWLKTNLITPGNNNLYFSEKESVNSTSFKPTSQPTNNHSPTASFQPNNSNQVLGLSSNSAANPPASKQINYSTTPQDIKLSTQHQSSSSLVPNQNLIFTPTTLAKWPIVSAIIIGALYSIIGVFGIYVKNWQKIESIY